jgi:hypothetical protein
VVGVADSLKGQVAMAFAVLKDPTRAASDADALKLEGEIMKVVDEQLGAVGLEHLAGEVGQPRALAARQHHVAAVRPALEAVDGIGQARTEPSVR